jgi:hypothetical protein
MPRAGGQEVDIRRSTFAALQEQPTPAGDSMPRDPPGMTRIANGITNWEKGMAFDYFFRVIQPRTPQGAEMIYWDGPKAEKPSTRAQSLPVGPSTAIASSRR